MAVFTDHLSQRFRTLAPDLRGYGKSRAPQPFELTDHLTDLSALVEAQGLEQFAILGWSLGGILAVEMALKHPDRVSALILIASAAFPYGDHPPITWQDNLYTGVASVANLALPGHPWVINALGKRSLYRYLIQQHTPAAYRRIAAEGTPAFLQTSKQAHRALNRALRQRYNRLDDLHRLTMPSLVLYGEADRHITAQSSLRTAQHLPNCQSKGYPETAHLFPWEIPDQVLADVDNWLSQHILC